MPSPSDSSLPPSAASAPAARTTADRTPQTHPSSPAPASSQPSPGSPELLQRWLTSKGLRSETLRQAGVVHHGDRLYFQYRLASEQTHFLRYIDLNAWAAGKQDKWWEKGSQAKGAYWPAYWSPGYSRDTRACLVCEGETDALAATQFGAPFDLVLAVPGAHTLDARLFDALISYGYELNLAFDRDPAGDAASNRAAWLVADRQPLNRLVYPDGVNDLRDCLLSTPDYRYERESVEQVPEIRPAPSVPYESPSWKYRPPQSDDSQKPSLQRVWDTLSPRTRSVRRDGRNRPIRQAWCPLHDDGDKPGAWVGEDRWGCWVCGIQGDVYELVAWVRGYAEPGQELRGDVFTKARDEARRLAP